MLEKVIKAAVKKRLKELGPECYSHWPVQMGLGAICLDCHGCYRGVYFAIETKAPGEKPTRLQQATIERIRAAGGLVFVVDSLESARALFTNHTFTEPKFTHSLQRHLSVVARHPDH